MPILFLNNRTIAENEKKYKSFSLPLSSETDPPSQTQEFEYTRHKISQKQVSDMVLAYHERIKAAGLQDEPSGILIGIETFQELLANKDVKGIAFLFAIRNGKQTLITAATGSDGNILTPIIEDPETVRPGSENGGYYYEDNYGQCCPPKSGNTTTKDIDSQSLCINLLDAFLKVS